MFGSRKFLVRTGLNRPSLEHV